MKVALVAKGYGWWHYKKDKDTFDEIWSVVSQFLFMGDDCTKVFEMHNFDWTYEDYIEYAKTADNPPNNREINIAMSIVGLKIDGINKRKLPLISVKKYDYIPTSIEYPREEIIRDVCNGRDFFTSTVPYTIAYAIYTGVKSLHLYGINAMDGYVYQHPSISWLIGIAEERGMKVHEGKGSALMKSKPYGYMV